MTLVPTSHSYFSQRLKLRYVEWGKSDGPTLLLVHGQRDHSRNWDWVAQDLAKDYRIIAPDLRGHGDSDWAIGSSYAMRDYIADIAQLVNQTTADDEKISIICHSFGGAIALRYAGVFPDKLNHIIAIEGLGPPQAMIKAMRGSTVHGGLSAWISALQNAASRTPKKYASLDDAIARMQDENSHLSYEQAKHLSVHGLIRNEDGTYTWKFDNYLRVVTPLSMTREDSKTLFERISCPVLLLRGGKSWADPLENDERVKYFSNVETHTIEDAGHWLHHDQLDEFLAVSRKFLEK